MPHTEANIKIARAKDNKTSISISMPIWTKVSNHSNLLIHLPFLGIETIAKNEKDSEIAIKEAIISFCIAADKFGQGLEKELQALGWVGIDGNTGEPILGFNIADTDALLDRLIQTGENYTNPHLEIA